MDGVKNLVLKQQVIKTYSLCFHVNLIMNLFFLIQKKLPITRITDNLMEQKSSPETDDYRYFDPKLIKSDGYKVFFALIG